MPVPPHLRFSKVFFAYAIFKSNMDKKRVWYSKKYIGLSIRCRVTIRKPLLWIRIGFGLEGLEFWRQKTAKLYSWKKLIFWLKTYFLIKNFKFLIPSPPWWTFTLQEKPSDLKTSSTSNHEISVRYHFKKKIFGSFLPSSIRIRVSAFPMRIRIQPTKINADPCESEYKTITEKQPNTESGTILYPVRLKGTQVANFADVP